MSTHDTSGRPWLKLSETKVGHNITADKGFTCLPPGQHLVQQDPEGLYVCCANGNHYLSGQADDDEHCIGFYSNKN